MTLVLSDAIDLAALVQELLTNGCVGASVGAPYGQLAAYDEARLHQLTEYVGHQVLAGEQATAEQQARLIDLLLHLAQQTEDNDWYCRALLARGDWALLETLDVAQAAAAYAQAPLGCTENQTVEKRLPFFVRNIALKLTKNQKQAAYALYQTMIGQATHLPPVSHAFAQQVKQAIDKQTQRAGGLTAAQQLTTMLIDLADLLDDDSVRALALRAQGNVYLYQQAYPDAIRCYRQAAALYTLHQQPLSAAEAEVGVVGALAQLGRYQEAEAVYQRISQLFARLEQWRPLAKVTGNLTILYNRQGRDREALAFADEAGRLLRRLGPTGLESLPLIENNRAISLRNLGRFADSIAASQSAYTLNQQLGQSAEGARALQTMAFTYFLRGHYNRALQLYDEAHHALRAGGRLRDALAGELEATDCLLQLRRFATVLQKCDEITQEFQRDEVQDILLRTYLNQATAYAGKRPADYAKARAALTQAQALVPPTEPNIWRATLDLNLATLLYLQGEPAESLRLALTCAQFFQAQALPINEAYAWLMAARAAFGAEQPAQAAQLLTTVQATLNGQPEVELPLIHYQADALAGALAEQQHDYVQAYRHYAQAIDHLERLRGRIMVEFTANFLEDKLAPYEQIVTLLLTQLHATETAWRYAERAKSRALVDLLANRIDLRVRPRHPADVVLVEELTALQAERSRLYRRQQSEQQMHTLGAVDVAAEAQARATAQTLNALGGRIEELWNTLLTHNADYERDGSAATVTLAQIQSRLGPDACLIEYFIAKEQLFVFLITAAQITAYPLTAMNKVRPLLTFLQMSLDLAPRTPPARIPTLLPALQGLLHQLYDALIAPIRAALAPYREWIIAPHGPLHALPFHTLFDGGGYLLEAAVMSYTPSAAVWYFAQQQPVRGEGALILAHTQGGALPGRAVEGQQVQALTGGVCLLEEAATIAAVQQLAPTCRLLHLATHGRFQSDNPLFSGLHLADGELTTFDIFNLELSLSLVVLSACETARAKVSSGDELLGLSRAFLYAGAQSLLLSQWKVADHATQQLMGAFYRRLMQGATKGEALRDAQSALLRHAGEPYLAHPFFWSAFFLLGNAGRFTPASIHSPQEDYQL
jgi:CHAT domain-containing protein/tetratricopeptide (TPR) repeat protein